MVETYLDAKYFAIVATDLHVEITRVGDCVRELAGLMVTTGSIADVCFPRSHSAVLTR